MVESVEKMEGDLQRDESLQEMSSSPVIEEFVCTSTVEGSAIHIKGRTSSDLAEIIRILQDAQREGMATQNGPSTMSWSQAFPQNGAGFSSSQPALQRGLTFLFSQPVDSVGGSQDILGHSNSQTSTGSAVLRDLYPSSQQSIRGLTTSQISNALARSERSFETLRHYLHTFPTTSQPTDSGEKMMTATFTASRVHYPMEQNAFFDDFQKDEEEFEIGEGRATVKTPADASIDQEISSMDLLSADQEDNAGEFGLAIRFPDCAGKDWVYLCEKKVLFVKKLALFDMEFVFNKSPPHGSLIRARAVFKSQGRFNEPVPMCVKHARNHNDNEFLYTDDIKAKYTVTAERAVVLPLMPPSKKKKRQNNLAVPARFGLRCWNSCYGTKMQIAIIFELIVGSKVSGHAHVNVRCCACPDRDSKMAEPTGKRGRKRKLNTPSDQLEDDIVNARPSCKEAGASVGSQPESCKIAKKSCNGQQFGVQQKYGQNEDGSYWLDMHGRVGADHIVFLNQLITTGEFLNRFCQMNHTPGPVAELPSGTPFICRAKPNDVYSAEQNKNALELRKWLRSICCTKLISEQVFIEEGVATLDDVFKLSKDKLIEILGGELMPETVEKLWMKIQDKDRPSPSTSPVTSSYHTGIWTCQTEISPPKKEAK